MVLITDMAPRGLETSIGGGNLLISVFDALGAPIPQADIHLVNTDVLPAIDANYQTNNEGAYLVAGAPASTEAHQITITKSGYSTDRTYGTDEVASPQKSHATVIEGFLTQTSFSIDRLSTFSVETLSSVGKNSFVDSFTDETKIQESSNVLISGGEVNLIQDGGVYRSSGYLISITIAPSDLEAWDEFQWDDSLPANTEIRYQVLYFDSLNWVLIPDVDLPGNSLGFDSSQQEVNLSPLNIVSYPELRIKANFATSDTALTPSLFEWEVIWDSTEGNKIGNVAFHLRGEKIIGIDLNEDPVYKYSQDHSTGASGRINISNLEWDSYTFSVDKAVTGLDLVETDPSPQPIGLLPNVTQDVDLILSAENSLLVRVRDAETAEPIFSAETRLFNSGLGYDTIQFTDEDGETLFIPLEANTYNWEVQVAGYQNASGIVSVSGSTIKTINLTPGEI